jgi:hypothetical protein
MGLPEKEVALTPEQVAILNRRLAMMRHNINNHLALIVAASELLKRKPEMAPRLIENIIQQPDKISTEMRGFSDDFEAALGISRDSGFSTTQMTSTVP